MDLSYIHGYVDNATAPIPPARPSRDSTLTALTQLGLLRLGAHRAFVSLFDHHYQYIVAETTASSRLRSATDRPTQEGLLLCGLAITHSEGVASHVLDIASESLTASRAGEGHNHAWEAPVFVVPDVQADERFKSSGLLALYRDIRFYAAVPIRSPAGSFIGVLAISDCQPRQDLSAVEADFLRELSMTVMDHFSLVSYRLEEARSKRMMRGLGSFMEGGATTMGLISDQWSAKPGGDAGREGMLNVAQQSKWHEISKHADQEGVTIPQDMNATDSYFAPAASTHSTTPATEAAAQQATGGRDTTRPLSRNPSKSTSLASSVKSLGNVPDSDPQSAIAKPALPTETPSPAPSVLDITDIFSRAANTIRESIEVEGVVFFDASIATFGGLVESGRRDSSDKGNWHSSQSSSSGEDSVRSVRSATSASGQSTKMCDIFGFSTTGSSSIDGHKPNAEHLAVPERFLRLLLRRYPRGKIFNFDEHGIPLSDTESESDQDHLMRNAAAAISPPPRRRQQSFTRNAEPSFIIKIFPNARSVIAFPLWDSNKSRWYAGGVAWTRTPTRVFSIRGELSYLRAFGASIMAEVAKADALKADKAKADVLGSISHELRSPLHGILGGVELLHETRLDVFQDSTAQTIEKCGMTLLDTVDHLLDYAKVNNLMRESRAARHTQRREGGVGLASKGIERYSKVAAWNVEVDSIIEEVVESIFAGHEFQTSSHSFDSDQPEPMSRDINSIILGEAMAGKQITPTPEDVPQDSVKIILDIRPAISWTFSTQVGALRRIVMNVFGNALKYTATGHIKVTVDQKDITNKASMSEVNITIEDTGKGVNKEYLAHHLYTAFSQEDPLSPGTGLGLSITHKIITSLGGTIDAKSKVGQGLTMSISLPLSHSNATETSREKSAFIALVQRTRGLRLSLSGFQDNDTSSTQASPMENRGWQLPRGVIEHQCQDWLHMDVLLANETAIKPDIYLATLESAGALAKLNEAGVVIQPVVVICPSAASARYCSTTSKTIDRNGVFEYISQP